MKATDPTAQPWCIAYSRGLCRITHYVSSSRGGAVVGHQVPGLALCARLASTPAVRPAHWGFRIVTGRGGVPDRLLGGDECWCGEPAGRGASYTDMVNELLPSVSSRLWCTSDEPGTNRASVRRRTRRRRAKEG